jgi:cell division protein FtsQ
MSTRFATHMRTTPDVDTSVAVPLDVRLMHMAASLMYVGFALALVGVMVWSFVRLPMFALTGITVRGDVEHNNAVTLRANVAPRLTGNFFTIDLERVRAAFEMVPWVRHASVQREFPNRLRVTLEEHRPVAFWGDEGDARLLNTYGEVFDASSADVDSLKMPRLTGPDSQSQEVLSMYRALAPLFEDLTLAFHSLELTDRGSWRARVAQGAVIELGRGSKDDVLPRVQRVSKTLLQVTQKYGRKINALESADLRHENGYALRLRGVSTLDVATKR